MIKHPRKDVYAVLDGHHRFHALLESGVKKIDCAVVGDFSSFMFYLTKDGWFQPPKEVTEYFRMPVLKFRKDLDDFLVEFSKNPEKTQKKMLRKFLKLIPE